MPEKITDPQKMVTDPVLLTYLAEQGIDKDYVEFFQDYASRGLGKEHSPYAKFYKDLISGRRFMVVSGLPMVDTDGVKIEVGWRVAGVNYFSEKNNLFRARVQGTQVELTIRNDQPDSRKANERLSYKPQLFLGGVEQICSNSILLAVDPVNPNYLENTLEWDYGICKRRLRIIEGSILGSWVFAQKPAGEVRIKYNQTGDYKLKLGQFKVSDDEELVKPEDFDELALLQGGYPVTVSDSATFYPDAHPETTSVDGRVQRELSNSTWLSIRTGAGTGFSESGTWLEFLYYHQNTNLFASLFRPIILFDINSLPATAVISAVTTSLYGGEKLNPNSQALTVNIYSSSPASNITLAAADYAIANFGTTAFATAITYAAFNAAGYNNFAFNAGGIAFVQTAADGNGIVKLSMREATFEVTGTTPTPFAIGGWVSMTNRASELGNGYKPKLVVTYTVPATARGWWSK